MKLLIGLCLVAAPLAGQVSYTPQPIDFGTVQIGKASAILRSTLKNTGPDTLKFCGAMPAGCQGGSRMTGSSAFRYITDNCTTRPPGTSCVLQYQFLPTTVGSLTGANVIQTTKGPFPLNLVGMGQDTVTPPPPPPPPPVAALPWDSASVQVTIWEHTAAGVVVPTVTHWTVVHPPVTVGLAPVATVEITPALATIFIGDMCTQFADTLPTATWRWNIDSNQPLAAYGLDSTGQRICLQTARIP